MKNGSSLVKFGVGIITFLIVINFNVITGVSRAQNPGFIFNSSHIKNWSNVEAPTIVWWAVGDSYTDLTFQATSHTASDVNLSTTDAGEVAQGATHYVGHDTKFSTIYYVLDNTAAHPLPTSSDSGRVTWQYYGAGGWTALTVNDYTKAYSSSVSFSVPTQTDEWIYTGVKFTAPSDWAEVLVGDATAYYIRAVTTTAYDVVPLGSEVWIDQSTDNKDLSINNVTLEGQLTPSSEVSQGDYIYYNFFNNIANANDFDLSNCFLSLQIDANLTPIGLYAPAIVQFFTDYPEMPWPSDAFRSRVLAAGNGLISMEDFDDAVYLEPGERGNISTYFTHSADYRQITVSGWTFPENSNFNIVQNYIKIAIRGDNVGTWPVRMYFQAKDQFGPLNAIIIGNRQGNFIQDTVYGEDYVMNTTNVTVNPVLPVTGRD